MRRRLVLLALALVVVGCSGDEDRSGPLESSLAYMPKDSPAVIALDTDLDGAQYDSLQEILNRFPGGLNLEGLLADQLEGGTEGVDFERDVRPLLGNPFVVSATDVRTFVGESEDDDFVAALQVEDRDALDALIEKTGAQERGEAGGATLYEDDGTFFAVEDGNVVLAGSRVLLERAVERAAGDDHFDLSTFERGVEGLPEEGLARLWLDVQALLAQSPDAEVARRIEWVRALRTLGATASVTDDSVDVEFNLRTSDLGEEDLPLAPGAEAPGSVQRPGEIGVAIRDPSQIVAFAEGALQAADPQGFGEYEMGKRAIEERLGVDVDEDLFGQLAGDLSVSLALDGSFGARAEVDDPQAFGETIDTIAQALPQLGAGVGIADVRRAGDLWEATLADGDRFFFGVSDGAFVAAGTRARALELAGVRPAAVGGAEGSLVMAADAERVALQLIEQLGSQLGGLGAFGGGLFARQLDELTGSMESSRDGMRGRLRLTLD